MNFWSSSVGKKFVMAITGLIWVGYLISHMLANLTVFSGPDRINAYSAFLHGTGPALWIARTVLVAAIVLHIVAAIQLTGRREAARPIAYARREPQVSTLASRTIRWGGALILVFLVFHLLHFTLGTVHSDFIEGNPYHNVVAGFQNPVVVLFYVVTMVAVGLHLYHGLWSSGRTLGAAPVSPRPMRRPLALLLAVLVWAGFTVIPLAVFAGLLQ